MLIFLLAVELVPGIVLYPTAPNLRIAAYSAPPTGRASVSFANILAAATRRGSWQPSREDRAAKFYTVGGRTHHISPDSVTDINACARVSIIIPPKEGDCILCGA